jgi:hypothetical protein
MAEVIEAAVRCGEPQLAQNALARLAETTTAAGTDWARTCRPTRSELEILPGNAVGDDQFADAVASNLASYGHPT